MSVCLNDVPSIRAMTLEDVDSVIAIEREVFLFPWTPGNFSDSINSGYHCAVLDKGGQLFGYGVMMIGAEEAHLLTLSIVTESRGKGWGEGLLRHFIQIAREQHVRSIFLDVRVSNHAAARLYERIGFTRVGRRRDYYPAMGGREDSLIMELRL